MRHAVARLSSGESSVGCVYRHDMMRAGRLWHASQAGLGGLGSIVGLKESLCAGMLDLGLMVIRNSG